MERRIEVNIGTRFLRSFQQSTTSTLLGDTPLLDEESPLRAELFSTDQMAQHGKALADAQVPFELHVFEGGAHGLALADGENDLAADIPHIAHWARLCTEWLEMHGL